MDKCSVEKFRKRLANISISDHYGLRSPGLTCYLNSVLQVLFMTSEFREAVRVKRDDSRNSACIDSHLAELFSALEKKVTTTHHIVKTLDIIDVYEQRDAAEYLEKILSLTSAEASQIFRGELNHKTTCLQCNDTNSSSSFFWMLPLSMEGSQHQAFDVERGLEAFFTVQKLSGVDQMFCDRCRGKQDANTKWELTQSPDVLTLLLKRFTYDYKQRRYAKLHCKATLPRTLRVESCTYVLYAVVNHFGNLSGGHYTADIRSFETGWWYCFNDGIVKPVKSEYSEAGEDSMRSCSAYLLMYRKEFTGSDAEAQRAQSHEGAERRRDKAEPEEAPPPPPPHRQLKDEGYIGEEGWRHVGVSSAKRRNYSAERTSGNQRRAAGRHRADLLPSICTNGQKCDADVKELHPKERRRGASLKHNHETGSKMVPTQKSDSLKERGNVRKRDEKVNKTPWRC